MIKKLIVIILVGIITISSQESITLADRIQYGYVGPYDVKVSDSAYSLRFKKYKKGYYQYLENGNITSGYLQMNAINLYFLANAIKGSSMKWLNEKRTKVQFVINRKKYIFTDNSYYYTVNGKKKPLSVMYYASKRPPLIIVTKDFSYYDAFRNKVFNKLHKFISIGSGHNCLYYDRYVVDRKIHDKKVAIKDRHFLTKFMNVPYSFLVEEGFIPKMNEISETTIYLKESQINCPAFIFTDKNKISDKKLLSIKYLEQFNTLPEDIRKIAIDNYKKKLYVYDEYTYLYKTPFQTLFRGNSWITRDAVLSLVSKPSWSKADKEYAYQKSSVRYYGDKATSHGVDISFVVEPGYTDSLKEKFNKLGFPEDFADEICKTVLAYNDWYELNSKMTYQFISSNGNTYKYVLGRNDSSSDGWYRSTLNILVPNHPAMVGEHFEGGYYIASSGNNCASYGAVGDLDMIGFREDFNLGYELPNSARIQYGMTEIKDNVNTWDDWRDAYDNDRSKLIKTMRVYK